MKVIEIVKQFLEDNSYDGLFSEHECACLKEDLAPCGEIQNNCQVGYKAPCPETCGEHYWHIAKEKLAPKNTELENVKGSTA